MKRIEMVHLISDNVLTSFFPDIDLRLKNLIADCILVEVEKNGMLPPLQKLINENNEIEGMIADWDSE